MQPITEEQYRKKLLFIKQKEEAIKKIAKQYYYDKFLKESDLLNEYVPKCESEQFQKYCQSRTGKRYKYIMVTINPQEGTLLKEIEKKVDKCLQKKWIDDFMYSYEQRGETIEEMGTGIHVHMKLWLDQDKNPYECKREIYNTFKHMVGNILHINVRYSNREGCFEDYIKGYKKGELKKTNHIDIIWRRKNDLLDYYKIEEPTSLEIEEQLAHIPQ